MRNSGERPAGPAAVDFPRPQKGNASQHVLVTMLAEFWRKTDLWLPARVVVKLAEDIGLSRPAVTTALSRLSARGVLENDGGGRASRYRFTAAARDRLVVGHKQVTEFGDPGIGWDRHWTAVAFSIPETDRDIREAFRARLKWLGFAPAYGALWFSPRDRVVQVTETAEGYGVDDFMAFRVEDTALQGRRPTLVNSEELPARYSAFTQRNETRLARLSQPGTDSREAFRMRIETMDEWRAFPWDDAGMPYELLPADWPLNRARSTFIDVYRGTAEGAQDYLHSVLTALAPDTVPGIRLPEIP